MALVKPSLKFHLNAQDVKNVAHNALIFGGPALLILLASVVQAVPADWKYATVTLYVLNVLLDVLKKFLAGK